MLLFFIIANLNLNNFKANYEKLNSDFESLKNNHENNEKLLDNVQKHNENLSEEKNALQDSINQFNRLAYGKLVTNNKSKSKEKTLVASHSKSTSLIGKKDELKSKNIRTITNKKLEEEKK